VSERAVDWASRHDPEDVLVLDIPEAGVFRFCVYPLGINGTSGVLAAGFAGAEAPSSFQRTILNVAANQAMIACKNLGLQQQQQWLYEKAQREIAERKKTELALRASDEFNRLLIESSRDCIKLLDLEGNLLWLSPVGCRALGVEDVAYALGRSWVDFWSEHERNTAQAALKTALNGGSGDFIGLFAVRGARRWWHVVISPILGSDGRPERLLAVSRDVTAHRLAEEALQASHAELKAHADELMRFNRAAVDRELRMIELKREVNALCAELGRTHRYPLDFEPEAQQDHA
jgi:PAS domain S-box-containing protein